MQSTCDGCVIIKHESAAAFIISLREVLLEDKAPEMIERFVFRGQGDAAWGLVPSAFRPGTRLGYENRDYSREVKDALANTWEQGNAELVALLSRAGHPR